MQERKAWHVNGFLVLLITLLLVFTTILTFIELGNTEDAGKIALYAILASIQILLIAVGLSSLTIVKPNEGKVLTFFGKYMGTILESGFWLVVPFSEKRKVSLKVRNFTSQKLKVNDAEGNPIEIAAVVVFKVYDTAKAVFDVDNYEAFVEIQSESAIRHIAAQYPYDNFKDDKQASLRGNADEVASELKRELQERLAVAGVEVLETRLTHLAYAPEIASAMLQRQQASAIVAARTHIVEGAVGMVEMALRQLKDKGIELDDERRAAMVNNLMVSIVSDRAATPVLNTGSLYS
jgi:regulator of protease activity HflC (stomatin/prohibitin superfamily)